MTPTFSIIHATLGRPEKALLTYRMWMDRATSPNEVEYIFGLHAHDSTANKLLILKLADMYPDRVKVNIFNGEGSAGNWNEAAKIATGDILIQAQDDVEPPPKWNAFLFDSALCDVPGCCVRDIKNASFFITTSDGYNNHNLCITTIISRRYYEQRGFFLWPEYHGLFADDDSTAQAYQDKREGKCTVIEARDLIFLHRHHSRDHRVPFDKTYEIENSNRAWTMGEELFMRRHGWAKEWLRQAPEIPNAMAGPEVIR